MVNKWINVIGVSQTVWRTALCITLLTDLNVEHAVNWLAERRRRLKRQSGIRKDASWPQIRSALITTVNNHDVDEMCSWIDPERATLGASALRQATKVAYEIALRQGIRQHNDDFEVPMPSDEVRAQWTRLNTDADFGIPWRSEEGRWKDRLKQTSLWAHRFRRRARVRLGIMRTTEPIGLEEKRAKVI